MDLELWGGISGVLLIVGLVELAKQALGFPSRHAGLLAVALGLLLSLGWTWYAETQWFRAVVTGLALGLSATGLWSTSKHAYRSLRKDHPPGRP